MKYSKAEVHCKTHGLPALRFEEGCESMSNLAPLTPRYFGCRVVQPGPAGPRPATDASPAPRATPSPPVWAGERTTDRGKGPPAEWSG